MNAPTALSALLVGALLVSACSTAGTSEPDEPSPTATTVTAPSTPSPSPSPSANPAGIREQSDPDLGIVFEDVPDLTGDEGDVYDTVALYRKAYWSTMTTNEVHPLFDVLASPELRATMENVAATNLAGSITVGGTYRVRISDISVADDGNATALTCSDYAEATFADPDGTYSPDEVGYGERRRHAFTLRHLGQTWQAATNEYVGPC